MQSAYNTMQAASVFSQAYGGNADNFGMALTNYQTTMAQNMMSQTENNMSIAGLQSQENALDLKRETLQTQLNAATQELENVKKAEEEAIKHATVKYVG